MKIAREMFVAASLLATLGCLNGDATAVSAPRPPAQVVSGAPDYAAWNALLSKYYDPAKGMNYAALKANDSATLKALRQRLGSVKLSTLDRNEQLAYLINLYNVNVVGIVVDNYPIKSIRDLSTDPIVRTNIFDKKLVPFEGKLVSLNDVENKKIREVFGDPRIHFAINCAARSCPPIRPEPFTGAKLNEQLDDQTRRFLNGPNGVKISKNGSNVTVQTTKVMDWFEKDFKSSGGNLAFLKKYVSKDKQSEIQRAKSAKVTYDDYDWSLNDWKR